MVLYACVEQRNCSLKLPKKNIHDASAGFWHQKAQDFFQLRIGIESPNWYG
jgi:hypothetical protein